MRWTKFVLVLGAVNLASVATSLMLVGALQLREGRRAAMAQAVDKSYLDALKESADRQHAFMDSDRHRIEARVDVLEMRLHAVEASVWKISGGITVSGNMMLLLAQWFARKKQNGNGGRPGLGRR